MFGRKKQDALKNRVHTIAARPAPQAGSDAKRMPRPVVSRAERLASFADCTVFYAGISSVAGILIDHSATGARLRFRHRHALPDRVRIVCPRLGIDRVASVVRRLDFDVGFEFVD
ncbi:MAG: PilZ domain-containing protein [Pseudomonadota bacterium]